MNDLQLHKIIDKKIAFFTAETIPSSAGGGRSAFYFARYFAQINARVNLYCLNYNNKLKNNEIIDGVSIERIPYYNYSFFHKLLSIPRLITNYYRKVRNCDTIFIYGRYLPLYIFILGFGLILNKKVIFRSTLLNDDDLISIRHQSFLSWPFYNFIFNRISLYWAINNQFKDNWLKVFSNKTPVLCSVQGVDTRIFNATKRTENKTDNKIFTILSCGILIERKGYRHIFESLSQLDINFRYIVVGQYLPNNYHKSSRQENSEMKELNRLGTELLKDKIEFINSTENMPELYSKADIFLHGAFSEGTPNVVLEAMAMGVPVLMKKLEGLSDVLVSGFNVEYYSNNEALKEKLLHLKNNPHYCNTIGTNASAIIEKNYSFNQIAGIITEKLYGG